MLIKCIPLGAYETNCYIVTDEKTLACAVIDPGADASTVLDYLERSRLSCRFILLTHAHFDHVGAVPDLLEETGATLCMHKGDDRVAIGGRAGEMFLAPEGTQFYAEGDIVSVDGLSFTVLETPGHTPGSVCLLCSDGADRALFAGDTLFRDSCGRTDFMAGSTDDMLRSLKRLSQLPGNCEVYPGHGFSTTLDRERSVNYFMNAAMRQ